MATTKQGPPPAARQQGPGPNGKGEARPAPGDREAAQAKNAATEFAEWLTGKSDQLARWCDGSPLTPDALIRFAGITFRREPKFHPRDVWPSIYLALATAAHLGLEPSGPLGEGWIVPRWDKRLRMNIAQWQTGYRGYITLLIRSGIAKRVRAFSVYDADDFRIEQGSSPRIHHEIFTGPGDERGDVIGAYAIAWLPSGEQEYEWVPRVDIDKSRDMASDNSAAWSQWFDQMARRLPIKRLANQLPISPRVRRAMEIENAEDQDAIQRVLEGSATEVEQQKALPSGVTSSWPTPRRDGRKEALKSKLGRGGVARAMATPDDGASRYGGREDEQMPEWSTEQRAADPHGDPPPDGDPPPPGEDDIPFP